MAIKFKFPIRYKILGVLSAVVVAAVAVYLFLASKIFYEDKTLLIYELNQTNVRTLAADLESSFGRHLDKLRLLASLSRGQAISAALEGLLNAEENLVHAEVYAIGSRLKPAHFSEPVYSRTWPKYLQTYSKNQDYVLKVKKAYPTPFDRVLAQGVWIKNSTLSENESVPLFTIATVVDLENGESAIVVALARLDKILESNSTAGVSKTYIIDSDGDVLVHSDQSKVSQHQGMQSDVLIQTAKNSKVRSEVRRFTEDGLTYLGSYYKVGIAGVIAASKVVETEAFAAAQTLVRKSLLYAAIVVTVAFLISLFFSHSLTEPIQSMLEATKRIAEGDFNRVIQVHSHDELAILASSFNQMTSNLRSSREQIEEYSRDLEKKVADRTEKLESQNVAIKEAQEALVRTTRLASVGEVAGRAAHEVLNPLTNITSRLEKIQMQTLQRESDDLKLFREILEAWLKDFQAKGAEGFVEGLKAPSKVQPGKLLLEEDLMNFSAILKDMVGRHTQTRTDLDFLLKESARISKIVNGMRQLTRVSGNRKPIDLESLLNEVLATMNDVMNKRKIQTELVFNTSGAQLLSDHDELIQVFSNLLRNSMQAIEEAQRKNQPVGNPAKVWISTERIQSEGGHPFLNIRIHDNGPGIAETLFGKVFDANFTTKTPEEGTGLGLSISRRFIRAYDGEIIVEKSTPAVETVFLIQMPEYHKT